MLAGVTIVAIVFLTRTPILILGIAAVIAAFLVFLQHRDLFAYEYKMMSWSDAGSAFAPYFLVVAVIIVALGYIVSIRTGIKGARVMVTPPASSGSASRNSAVRPSNEFSLTPLAAPRNNFGGNTERREFVSALNRAI